MGSLADNMVNTCRPRKPDPPNSLPNKIIPKDQ